MPSVNAYSGSRITDDRTRQERDLSYYAANTEKIPIRLAELDREWDLERALQAGVFSLSLAGLGAGLLRNRLWLLVPLLAQGVLAAHTLTGNGPAESLLRFLGYRTRREIEVERFALKALRGDFRYLPAEGEDGSRARALQVLHATSLT